MIVALSSGSIDAGLIGPPIPVPLTPPNPAVLDLIPHLAFHTFVAQGGPTSDHTVGGPDGITLGAGAVDLGGDRHATFGAAGINQAWNASPGNSAATDLTDMLVAQVTLSPDAQGYVRDLASAAGQVRELDPELNPLAVQGLVPNAPDAWALPIVNGAIGVPEPSAIVLVGISVLGLIAVMAPKILRCVCHAL